MDLSSAFWLATDVSTNSETASDATPSGAPLLIFRLGAVRLAIPALAAREIHPLPLLSPLPGSAPFVPGMFDLRGEIVPVLDLSVRLGRAAPPPRLDDALIVLSWNGQHFALLASEVLAVSHVLRAQIGATGERTDGEGASPFIAGVTQIDGEIVLLLHLPHLLDFSIPSTPMRAAETALAPPAWSDEQREILLARAVQLRAPELDAGENEELAIDAAPDEQRVPVAVFSLGGEEFAAPLRVVREFTAVTAVARVPCCPPHILGQINLRGDIVTLLDVRQTLRTARTTPPFFATPTGAVSVVVVQHEGESVGIAVDEVRDVLYLRPEEWSALDSARSAARGGAHTSGGGATGHPYFAGGATYQGRVLPLLDIGQLLEHGGLEVDESA